MSDVWSDRAAHWAVRDDERLSATEKLVAHTLITRAALKDDPRKGHKAGAWSWSLARIAADAGVKSRTTVRDTVRKLEALGIIGVTERKVDGSAESDTHEYRIKVGWQMDGVVQQLTQVVQYVDGGGPVAGRGVVQQLDGGGPVAGPTVDPVSRSTPSRSREGERRACARDVTPPPGFFERDTAAWLRGERPLYALSVAPKLATGVHCGIDRQRFEDLQRLGELPPYEFLGLESDEEIDEEWASAQALVENDEQLQRETDERLQRMAEAAE